MATRALMSPEKTTVDEQRRLVPLQNARKTADSLGFPEGWLVFTHGRRKEYKCPEGKLYKSLKEIRASSVLDSDFLSKLELDDLSSKGLSDATEFGFPEGWKVKVYKKAKVFFSPEGVQYGSLLAATKAAKAGMAMMSSSGHEAANSSGTSCKLEQDEFLIKSGKDRQRGTQILWGRQARKSKKSEQEDEAEVEENSRVAKRSRPSVEVNHAPRSESTTQIADMHPGQHSNGYTIDNIPERSEWTIVPDDVLWIDLQKIGSNIEAAGWILKDESSPRVFRSGLGGSSLTLSSCGMLIVGSCQEQMAYHIASVFVNDWLVNA